MISVNSPKHESQLENEFIFEKCSSTLAGALKYILADTVIQDPLVIWLYPPLFQLSYEGMREEGEHWDMGSEDAAGLSASSGGEEPH